MSEECSLPCSCVTFLLPCSCTTYCCCILLTNPNNKWLYMFILAVTSARIIFQSVLQINNSSFTAYWLTRAYPITVLVELETIQGMKSNETELCDFCNFVIHFQTMFCIHTTVQIGNIVLYVNKSTMYTCPWKNQSDFEGTPSCTFRFPGSHGSTSYKSIT